MQLGCCAGRFDARRLAASLFLSVCRGTVCRTTTARLRLCLAPRAPSAAVGRFAVLCAARSPSGAAAPGLLRHALRRAAVAFSYPSAILQRAHRLLCAAAVPHGAAPAARVSWAFRLARVSGLVLALCTPPACARPLSRLPVFPPAACSRRSLRPAVCNRQTGARRSLWACWRPPASGPAACSAYNADGECSAEAARPAGLASVRPHQLRRASGRIVKA